jgi:hypothetical protein
VAHQDGLLAKIFTPCDQAVPFEEYFTPMPGAVSKIHHVEPSLMIEGSWVTSDPERLHDAAEALLTIAAAIVNTHRIRLQRFGDEARVCVEPEG